MEEIKFETCQKCPLKDSCNLIKGGNELQCTMNADKRHKVDYKHTSYVSRTVFKPDISEDSFESDIV